METGERGPLQSVVCSTHGLRYDPRTQSGCVRCRAEVGEAPTGAATGPAQRDGPPLVVWLLGIAALAVVALLILGRRDEPPASAQASGAAVPPTASGESNETRRAESVVADAGGAPSRAPAAAEDWPTIEAFGSAEVVDEPEDEVFRVDDLLAPDLESVRFQASANTLTITFEFTRTLESDAFDFGIGIAPATVFVDTDLDPATGESGFAGRGGFERAVASYVGVKYDPDADGFFWAGGMAETPIVAFACSHDVGTVSGYFVDTTFDPADEEALAATTCFGNTLEVRVPYERLGVTAGQTVRLATQEDMGSGTVSQYFLQDVVLTLG
jgi:hypothetical protein